VYSYSLTAITTKSALTAKMAAKLVTKTAVQSNSLTAITLIDNPMVIDTAFDVALSGTAAK
jgi:hypothetical protein